MKSSPLTESAYTARLKVAFMKRWGPLVDLTKIHGGPYQRAGVSDLLVCLQGRYVAVELKRPREQPTLLQLHFLDSIQSAQGIAVIVDTDVDLDVLTNYLQTEVTGTHGESGSTA